MFSALSPNISKKWNILIRSCNNSAFRLTFGLICVKITKKRQYSNRMHVKGMIFVGEPFNDLGQIQKQDNNKRILFSIVAMLLISTVPIVILFLLKDKYDGGLDTSSDASSAAVSGESDPDVTSQPPEESLESDPNVSDTSSDAPNESTEESSQPSDESSDTSGQLEMEHGWVINNLGYTYLYYDRGLEQFTASTAVRDSYIRTINKLKSSVGSANFYHMLIPTQVEFTDIPTNIKQEDNFYSSSQKSFIDTVAAALESGSTNVNVYDRLQAAYEADEYIYFRTDINWTALAAYYAYTDFASSAGFEPAALDVFPIKSYENFLGRFYTATGAQILKDNADSILYYDVDSVNACIVTMYSNNATYNNRRLTYSEVSDTSNGYNVFLGGVASRFKITTEQTNGKKILVIGDTSAMPFVPFLTSDYQEVQLINPQYYKGDISAFVQENGFDDVLVMSYTTSASKLYYHEYFENLYNG